MALSVNTNMGAMVALQNLNATNMELGQTQNRINTGKKVSNAKDNGAIWAIAQGQRATSGALNAVKDSLNRGSSAIDVAIAGGESVSDLLLQMKEKALAASDTSLDSASRTAMNEDFKALRDQITKAVANADFNGVNLIKTGASAIAALANADGSSKLTVSPEVMALGGSVVTVATTGTIGTVTTAAAMITTVTNSIANVSASLARLGTKAKAYEMHNTFIGKLQDSLDAGIGNLVDADLAKESAKLQALQTKQQLGVQALSIANQTPQTIMSLFRG
ncbi:flagellin [Caulobacter sp. NIBR1757]|uniref:flagellin n=1 Tax=Caulobacter sp. NIBR1757 TaxID=3016000 RepID=UPI0022F05CD9|nr:flagellin [Caulobacter sp. NIBR1757]WGM38586.1 Flagellin [Caulobacter sp. NIBR1757]